MFNNINKVEVKLVQLTTQMNNAKASKKANIRSLIKTYEVQQKRLLSKIAANKANEAKSVKESKKETKAEINTLSPKRNNNKEDYGSYISFSCLFVED